MERLDFIKNWVSLSQAMDPDQTLLLEPETLFLIAAKCQAIKTFYHMQHASNFLKGEYLNSLLAMPPFAFTPSRGMSQKTAITTFLNQLSSGQVESITEINDVIRAAEQGFQTLSLNPTAQETDFSYQPMNAVFHDHIKKQSQRYVAACIACLAVTALITGAALMQSNVIIKAIGIIAAIAMVGVTHYIDEKHQVYKETHENNFERNYSIYRSHNHMTAMSMFQFNMISTNGMTPSAQSYLFDETSRRFTAPRWHKL